MKSLRRMMANHDPYLLIASILRSSFSFLFPNFIFPYVSTINCYWLVNTLTTFAEHKSHLEIPKCIPPVKDSEHQVRADGSFFTSLDNLNIFTATRSPLGTWNYCQFNPKGSQMPLKSQKILVTLSPHICISWYHAKEFHECFLLCLWNTMLWQSTITCTDVDPGAAVRTILPTCLIHFLSMTREQEADCSEGDCAWQCETAQLCFSAWPQGRKGSSAHGCCRRGKSRVWGTE